MPINDSAAGGTYYSLFTRVYSGTTDEGTPVYIYVPQDTPLDGSAPTGVHSPDPAFDHNPDDEFVPCADNLASEFTLTQEQIDYLGDQLTDQIVAVNEDHFGPMDAADPDDPASDSLVTLVYNVQDRAYYDWRGHDLHRGLLRAGLHDEPRHERHHARRLRLGEPRAEDPNSASLE